MRLQLTQKNTTKQVTVIIKKCSFRKSKQPKSIKPTIKVGKQPVSHNKAIKHPIIITISIYNPNYIYAQREMITSSFSFLAFLRPRQ